MQPKHVTPELAQFCRDEYPRLVGSLSLYCGQGDVAQELAQEALAIACRDWKKVRNAASPRAWLYRAAINLANSYFRRKAAERRARARLEGRRQEIHHDPDPALVRTVRDAVAGLPKRQRTALVVRYYLDLPVDEAATLMDCSPGTVKALCHQAISSLRQRAGLTELREASNAV